MSKQNLTCKHPDGISDECGGELVFSHEVTGKNKTFVYICMLCGERTEIIQEAV